MSRKKITAAERALLAAERSTASKPTMKDSTIVIESSFMGQRRGYRRNDLDMELRADEEMLASELKNMRVDEIVLKRKARLAKLKKEIDDIEKESKKSNTELMNLDISLPMAAQISNLPEEEQQKILQTYIMFKSANQPGGGAALLPMLTGFSRSNPGSSRSDMAVFAKSMSDNFKTGVEVMKASMPQQSRESSTTELLKLFSTLVTDSVKQPMTELIKNLSPQPSAFEQILLNPELYARAKDIGMFGAKEGAKGGTSIDLEIEKLRGERELSIKKMDLEWRMRMLENEQKDRRTDAILSIVAPGLAIASKPIEDRMRQMGRNTVNPYTPNPPTQQPPLQVPQQIPQNYSLQIKCTECGYDETQNLTAPPPEIILCPNCSTELKVGGAPTGNT